MERRQDAPSSSRPPNSTNPVNNFTPQPSIGPFFGAGRRRSADRSAAARERREDAAEIAALLVEGGLAPDDVYLTAAEIGDTMLALDDSENRDWLGRPRRAWAGYPDHAHILKTKVGREYALFADANDIGQVIQVVIRPPESVYALTSLAARHAADSATLGEMLRYARNSRAPDFAWDVVSAEICNAGQGGWLVDGHFHLTTRGADSAALRAIQEYFEARGWAFWFTADDDEDAGRHPAALVQYQSKGLAAAVNGGNGWCPDALAELRRQTFGLAMTRATGAFRVWKAEVARAGLAAVEDSNGKPTLAPRRIVGARLRRKLRESTSIVALRLCVHDFGDGLFRRSIRVRGAATITLADVAAVYDLDHITLSKVNTATPESNPSRPPPAEVPPPSDPPDGIHSPTAWRDDIPW